MAEDQWAVRENCLRYSKRWLIPLAVALGGMVLVRAGVPERMTFALARPGMLSIAKQVQSTGNTSSSASAGITRFSEVVPVGRSGTVFIIEGSGFISVGGWAYLPDPADKPAQPWDYIAGSSYQARPIGGGWYEVHYDPF